MRKAEFIERYGIEAYQRQVEKIKEYQKTHKTERAARDKQYREKHRDEIREKKKQYELEHREEKLKRQKQYRERNKDSIREKAKAYYNTQNGRATSQVGDYIRTDKEHNRQFTTEQVTVNYIIERIYKSRCIYCGESDWYKLGVDRKDNNLPHQIGNMLCACWSCNNKRGTRDYKEFLIETKLLPILRKNFNNNKVQ